MFALLAQATDPAGGAPQVPFYANPLFVLVIFGLFYVVFLLPMTRRQKKEQEKLLATLKPGAKVVTASGIVGKVVKAKDGEDEITVQSEDAKIRILRSAVTRVVDAETPAETK